MVSSNFLMILFSPMRLKSSVRLSRAASRLSIRGAAWAGVRSIISFSTLVHIFSYLLRTFQQGAIPFEFDA